MQRARDPLPMKDHIPLRVSVCAKSDLGRTREHNEDTFLVADLSRGTTELSERGTMEVGPRGLLFMVADGMGGAAAGELASAMAAQIVFEHLKNHWPACPDCSGDEFINQLQAAVEKANAGIFGYAKEHPEARGMGTTATVAGVLGSRLYLIQVGDSRAYLTRGQETAQLTKDQSLMQRLIDVGELTEEQAARSERRNIILQALGPEERIRADVTYQDLARGDTLLLCSDGLTGQVTREEIGQAVVAEPDLATLCSRLIDLANGRGGPDNITVVAARFDGAGLPDAAPPGDLGYHTYPLGQSSEEAPAPPPKAATPPAPAPRSGGPLTIAAIGVAALLGMLALYLLLTRVCC